MCVRAIICVRVRVCVCGNGLCQPVVCVCVCVCCWLDFICVAIRLCLSFVDAAPPASATPTHSHTRWHFLLPLAKALYLSFCLYLSLSLSPWLTDYCQSALMNLCCDFCASQRQKPQVQQEKENGGEGGRESGGERKIVCACVCVLQFMTDMITFHAHFSKMPATSPNDVPP